VDRVEVEALFDAEYKAFVELACALSAEEWGRPSLCERWTCGDVVLHIAYHTRKSVSDSFRSRDKVVARMIDREHADTREGLLEWLQRPVPDAARRDKGNVCVLVIHSQDIRRVIQRPRDYPEATMRLSLDTCTTMLGTLLVVGRTRRVAKNLRLVATDIDWSFGEGAEVSGTAEALLMAVSARPLVLADLSGDGVATMAQRLGVATSSVAP
jgi:uncharacterized protein (TIGR03083 family)